MWPKNASKSHIITFTAVTLLASWGIAYLVANNANQIGILGMVMVIPTITAISLNIIHHRSIFNIYQPVVTGTTRKSLVFAVLYPIAFAALTGVIALLTGKAEINSGSLPLPTDYLLHLVGIVLFMVMAFGEEYGWRGFLLPALSEHYGKLTAALLVGAVWALYHAPGSYVTAAQLGAANPWLYTLVQMLLLIAWSLPLAYCYFQTKGSIIGVILFRAVWDIAHGLVLGQTAGEARTILTGSYFLTGVISWELVLSLAAAVWFAIKLKKEA